VSKAKPCACSTYSDLKLSPKSLVKRIEKSPRLKKRLEKLTQSADGWHQLWWCPVCGQFWQRSCVWNWDGHMYLFKVPRITFTDWWAEPYVQPDALLIYQAALQQYMERQTFEPTERTCQIEGCPNYAITLSVLCLPHHIAALQETGGLPSNPPGRWFPPYQPAPSTTLS
jgi:hypothetical protein